MTKYFLDLWTKLPNDLATELADSTTSSHYVSQIHSLIHFLELKEADYENIEAIRYDTEKLVKKIFENYAIYLFGSCASGLGFQGSDIDLVLPMMELEGIDHQKNRKIIVKLGQEIRRSRRYCNVQIIPKARVPLVKYMDLKTQISIDLSCKNSMAYHNTRMIRAYVESHRLVRPYLTFLKLWSKSVGVSESGKAHTHISSYAITLMGLFVLMNREDPIIPPFEELLANDSQSHQQIYVNSWQCSFDTNLTKWAMKEHSSNVFDLVEEFFQFYSKLQEDQIICTLLGKLLPVSDICLKKIPCESERLLPRTLQRFYYENISYSPSFLNVQDPIEHSFNCTLQLNQQSYEKFQETCRRAAITCREIIDGKSPLKDLLSLSLKKMRVYSCTFSNNGLSGIDLPTKGFLKPYPGNTSLERVYNIVYCIFSYCLLCEPLSNKIEEKSDESPLKRLKTTNEPVNRIIPDTRIDWIAPKDLWKNRMQNTRKRNSTTDVNIFEKENEISQLLSSSMQQLPLQLRFHVEIFSGETVSFKVSSIVCDKQEVLLEGMSKYLGKVLNRLSS